MVSIIGDLLSWSMSACLQPHRYQLLCINLWMERGFGSGSPHHFHFQTGVNIMQVAGGRFDHKGTGLIKYQVVMRIKDSAFSLLILRKGRTEETHMKDTTQQTRLSCTRERESLHSGLHNYLSSLERWSIQLFP